MTEDKYKISVSSIMGVVFYGMLVAIFGGFIGALYMSSFAPRSLSTERDIKEYKEDLAEKGNVSSPAAFYFMEGPVALSQSWETKRQAIIDGKPGTLVWTHEDINGWFDASFRPATPDGEASNPNVMIIPGIPNVFIGETDITVSLPTKVTIYGIERDYTIIAKGVISDFGGVTKFVVEDLKLNNAPLPLVDLLGKQVVGTFLEAYRGSEEFIAMQDAWSRIDSVEQSAGVLRFKLR